MHTACQTCTFWLHPGKVWQCYSLAVRLSSAEAMCRARYGKARLFQREIGDRLSPLQMLLVMRSQEMPPSTSGCLPLFPSPPYSFLSLTFSLSLPLYRWLVHSAVSPFRCDLGCFWRARCRPAGTSRSSLASMCALVVFKLFPTSVLRSSQFLPVKN